MKCNGPHTSTSSAEDRTKNDEEPLAHPFENLCNEEKITNKLI